MIYSFTILNDENKTKQFYLTADNHSQLYRRIAMQYGATRDKVTLLEEYEEGKGDKLTLKKSYIKHISDDVDKRDEILKKARLVFSEQKRRSEKDLVDYITRHKLQRKQIQGESDLYDLVQKYKFLKIYATPGEKRGEKLLYAVYK